MMLVKFNSDWPPLYKRGAVLELPDRIAVHFVDRCIATALRPGEAPYMHAAPEAGRASAAPPRESSVLHQRETSPPPRRGEGIELNHSAPVTLRFK
jgi:hypothetical protein